MIVEEEEQIPDQLDDDSLNHNDNNQIVEQIQEVRAEEQTLSAEEKKLGHEVGVGGESQ